MSINSTDHSDCPRKKGFSRRGAGEEAGRKWWKMARKKKRKKERRSPPTFAERALFFPRSLTIGSSLLSFSSPSFHPFPFLPRYAGHTGLWLATFGGEKTLNTRDIFPWWSIRDRKLAAIDAASRKENRKITPVISSRGKSWGNRGVGSFF